MADPLLQHQRGDALKCYTFSADRSSSLRTVASVCALGSMPRCAGRNPDKGHVDGLAKALANRETIRGLMLRQRTLLSWPSPQTTGVISGKSIALNKALMVEVARILCPQGKYPLGLIVPRVFAEAGPAQTKQCIFLRMTNKDSAAISVLMYPARPTRNLPSTRPTYTLYSLNPQLAAHVWRCRRCGRTSACRQTRQMSCWKAMLSRGFRR